MFKQGAKHAGKQAFKQGAKQAGKVAFKHGTKQAFKQGTKQAFKQGAKQAGKQAFKQGTKQTAKEGVKQAGRAALGATVVVELVFLGLDLYNDYQLYSSGEISRKEFCKQATSSFFVSVGSVGGAIAGGIIGTMVFPVVGTFVGGVISGVIGYFGGKAVGSEVGENFCEGDDSEEPLEDSMYGVYESSDGTILVKDLDSEENTFCHHDCDDEVDKLVAIEDSTVVTNSAEDPETTTDDSYDINDLDSNGALDFYFQSNDSESGEEIPMKGVLFPIFGNIQTVCWENLEEGNFCYCTIMTEL